MIIRSVFMHSSRGSIQLRSLHHQLGSTSSSSRRLQLCQPSRRPTSSKAGQLLSAAQVSSADADLNPAPTPEPSSTWAIPRPLAEDDPERELDDDDEPYENARQRRLSPVGLASLWHIGGPVVLPSNLRDAMGQMVWEGDSKLLRSDVKLMHVSETDTPIIKRKGQDARAALLHLATAAPQRYATMHHVFKTTAQRLARPLPYSDAGEEGNSGWVPKRIVDVGCAAGEGAWAASEIWPGLQQWSGIDNRPELLATGETLISLDGKSDEPSLLSQLRDKRTSSVEFERSKDRQLRCPRPSPDGEREGKVSGQDTLTVSAYQLLSLSGDGAREKHVRSLWDSGAEVIVLIEEGTRRGFAAIASARALLTELGDENKRNDIPKTIPADKSDGEIREKLSLGGVEYIEEKPVDRQIPHPGGAITDSPGRGCYVVAPCPHDRPCPILHPFMLDLDHGTLAAVGKRSGPSNHHRASTVGLESCVHPVRYFPTRFSLDIGSEEKRRKKAKGGREERSAHMAYVVVKRGERPTVASMRRKSSATSAQIEAAVPFARRGPIEEMRKGDSVPRRLPEDVIDVEGEDDLAEFQSGLAPGGEIFNTLPLEIREALSASLAEAPIVQDSSSSRVHESPEQAAAAALRLQGTNAIAADVWKASADAATVAAHEQDGIEESEGEADSEHKKDWLPSLLAANESRTDESALGEEEIVPDAVDVSSAVSLLVPSLPRILSPPLKKGGHVTFDACHSNGSIQRYTISKAAGKQTYHEVRKSSWADQWSQDPVEMAASSNSTVVDGEEQVADGRKLSVLETRDETTGKRVWVKRRGWGQWSRVAPADPAAGMAMDGVGVPSKPDSSSSRRFPRASDRPSAYIGADQVCPVPPVKKEPRQLKGAKFGKGVTWGKIIGAKKRNKQTYADAVAKARASGAAGQRPQNRKAKYAYDELKESSRKKSRSAYQDEVSKGFEKAGL